MDTEKEESKFRYTHYKSRKIDLEKLNKVMDIVLNSGTSKFASIIAAIKVILFGVYLWVRKKIIDEDLLIIKQNYEQTRIGDNENDINEDDLD